MKIDLTYLNTVSGGDNGFVKDILELFLMHTLTDAEALGQYIHEENWPMASSAAHKIKSSVTMLGNERAIELVTHIEHTAKGTEALSELKNKFAELKSELDEMSIAIKQYLND